MCVYVYEPPAAARVSAVILQLCVTSVYVYVYVYMHTHASVCLYVCVCVYVSKLLKFSFPACHGFCNQLRAPADALRASSKLVHVDKKSLTLKFGTIHFPNQSLRIHSVELSMNALISFALQKITRPPKKPTKYMVLQY
jgi:hypothetical protein